MEKERTRDYEVVEEVVSDLLERSIPIEKAAKVKQEVQRQHDVEISLPKIKLTMKKELGLGYRRVKKVPIQGNSERCLVLRQQYALEMLPLLKSGRRVINIDESWLNETNFIRKMWAPSDAARTVTQRMVSPRLAIIAALDTEGRVYFSLTHANTDSNVMLVFLRHLMRQLDRESPGWAEEAVFLYDGARYHTSEMMRDYFRKLQVSVMFSGPYSYAAAPIELLFGGLKFGELNPERQPTGKKVSTALLFYSKIAEILIP